MKARTDVAVIQARYPGLWVAVVDGEVVEARENPHTLALALHDRSITRATILRCPADDEPELVGLG